MNRAKMRAAMLAAIALGLAGCSSQGGGLGALGAPGQIARSVMPAKAPVQVIPFDLTAPMISETNGNVLMAQFESRSLVTPMVLSGRNGEADTYSAAGIIALTLRDGIVLATRGFGDDMMSARIPTRAQVVAASAGHRRSYEFFDGLMQLSEVDAPCVLERGGTAQVVTGGKTVQTRIIAETCNSPFGRIDNSYWVTAGGKIVKSRQWISPGMGYVDLLQPG